MPSILKIDLRLSTYHELQPVVEVLLRGGLVAGPTQTFYGLMAAADRPEAMERIMALKGRNHRSALLLLIDRVERCRCYAKELPESAQGLVNKFWPGPLTLLLRARPGLHPALVGPRRTVGLRVEGLRVIRELVRALDRAVTGTSANLTGEPPAVNVQEVRDYFGDQVDLIIDGGVCPGGAPTTIIDASMGPPRLIRDGGLSLDEMMSVAPTLRT